MKYIVIYIAIFFISCTENKKNEESLEVYYIRDGVNYPIDINCEAIRDKGFDEIREVKLIKEAEFISKFKILYKELKPSPSNKLFNVKMQVITHFEGQSDTICIGDFNQIAINGENKNDSKELKLLIKNEIGKKGNVPN
jgi:hypothetical protein